MSSIVNTGAITLPKASAFTAARFLRVKLAAGVLALAAKTDTDELGVLEDAALNGDTFATVSPTNVGTVRKFVAGAAIAQHAKVYPAAAGKVDSVATTAGRAYGIAKEAASGDGSHVEVIMFQPRTVGT